MSIVTSSTVVIQTLLTAFPFPVSQTGATGTAVSAAALRIAGSTLHTTLEIGQPFPMSVHAMPNAVCVHRLAIMPYRI